MASRQEFRRAAFLTRTLILALVIRGIYLYKKILIEIDDVPLAICFVFKTLAQFD